MIVHCESFRSTIRGAIPTIPLSFSVNEIFDPDRVDTFYNLSLETQQKTILSDKSTNYGVVRPELLDQMYEKMYHQRLREPDQSKWRCKIVTWREVTGAEVQSDGLLLLRLRNTSNGESSMSESSFHLVIVGTGYERNMHESLLRPTRDLLRDDKYTVERNYRLKFRQGAVADNCGIWLQGCCEESHGVGVVLFETFQKVTDCQCEQLSDTLLSILAVRGGEMVDSIFPKQNSGRSGRAKL